MSNASSSATSERPSTLLTLAHLLERLDHSAVPFDAAQYRLVATRLATALESAAPGAELQAVLAALPAAAELYENLNYQYAGLCRSPLQSALDAELAASELIRRIGDDARDVERRPR